MKNSSTSPLRHQRQGVALVLVLCFVVLITGLVVAYFSRTLVTRQLSSASTSTTNAEQLANGATDVILGDLKQEIASGSLTSTPSDGNTIYFPSQAANAVPQRNNPGASSDPIPNLVRRSVRSDSIASPAVGSRASAASSSTSSLNGRAVSTARWNRHYLVPTAASAASNALTASTPVSDFTAPDWVFVTAEKGPDVMASPTKDASGASVTATGRYAYAIYDEGGLLDINHTGYPSMSTLSHVGAKPAPSYADLTQMPLSTSDSSTLSAANVDNLLGWRQYATLQSSGTFPGLQPSTSLGDSAYYNLFASPTAIANSIAPSFLQVPLTVWNNKTDQMFLSRQQLISYFATANLDPRYLQYFATFSRSLNQPSYLPEHSTTTLAATRPVVRNATLGGNNSSGNTGITPNFLTARVATTFKRYDGTDAIVGEPLLKKRFPLNRLAWLTYKGPSVSRSLSDPDIAALLASGITADFLKQGTPANILTYFGLQWDPTNNWTYVHGSNGANGAILNVSNPASADVVHATPAREPDFFELLKASINPGSIAKTSLSASVLTPNDPTNAPKMRTAQNQYGADISLDAAILQIGANIIDQFDTDGFPTRINYDLAASGSYSSKVYGIENLPYISRVRAGLIRLKEAVPPECDTTVTASTAIQDTGVAALMNYPEIWNPHDWSSANLAQSVGVVGPSNFKIYAETNQYNGVPQSTSVYAWLANQHESNNADPNQSPGFQSLYKFPFGSPNSHLGGEARTLTEDNTLMTFTIDRTSTTSESLFREPTILCKPAKPDGSQLASPALASGKSSLGALGLPSNSAFFGSSGGLVSAVNVTAANGPFPQNGATDPVQGAAYVGFYLGAHPLRWWDRDGGTNGNVAANQTQYGPVVDVAYTLACDDGNNGWIYYDVKPVTSSGQPDGYINSAPDTGFGLNGTTGPNFTWDFGIRFYETLDPRGNRFGMIDPWIQKEKSSIPPRQQYSYVNALQYTVKTDREDVNSGAAIFFGALTGNNPYGANDWYSITMGWYHDANLTDDDSFRPGLFSQNNPSVTPDQMVGPEPMPAKTNATGTFPPFYYADADGVVRRASGGNVPGGVGVPATSVVDGSRYGRTDGLAMAYANATYSPAASSGTTLRRIDSRPVILNRPFRSVAELGYVYSGTPWKNLDFFLPESGDTAMLDVFCINDNSDPNGLTAGQVNLNTHQAPVLQAILAMTNKDQWNDASTTAGTVDTTILGGSATGAQAQQIAQLLVTRTVTGPGSGVNLNTPQPLQNVSDLVGRWVREVDIPVAAGGNATTTGGISGQSSCDGLTADIATTVTAPDRMHNIQRFGESAIRALSNAGQTRVWNLMFDVVAQTGRFATQATTLDQFNVEGEQHYWVHVAIDRYTGQILDKQVEVVKE